MSVCRPDVQSELVPPFLKWAGGKRWFAAKHLDLVPKFYCRYVEPFLGSGAVFFALRPKQSVLSDLNADLIDCYEAIRQSPGDVQAALLKHHNLHSKEYYYSARASKPIDLVDKAAWFLYMNRTCWNGLYRVNKNNVFNVPIGTKTNVILESDDFARTSELLCSSEILAQDFQETINGCESGDFVFVDPPYTVKHNNNGFLKYNDSIFSWGDQERLRDCVLSASKRGVKVLVTNANHESIRDLYRNVGDIIVLDRSSVLSGDASFRVRTQEIVVRTYVE